ncbi:MetQ/NlpA family ABC transporter substrate-binding protein, partial [Escherichia sp. TWPC-MK]
TQLSEVKAAAINTNFALGAKLSPAKDSIFREGKDSPYVNWVVVLAVAVLPLLGIGGAKLYQSEMPGPFKDDKLTPRLADTSRTLW